MNPFSASKITLGLTVLLIASALVGCGTQAAAPRSDVPMQTEKQGQTHASSSDTMSLQSQSVDSGADAPSADTAAVPANNRVLTAPITPSASASAITQAPDPTAPALPAPTAKGQQLLVRQTMQLAQQGLVRNCPFAADTNRIDQVKQEYGQPDRMDAIGKGVYVTYQERGFAFGFNKGGQIFDVRTYAPLLQALNLQTVETELGKPNQIHYYENQYILVYNAGSLYQLEWIFPQPTRQNPLPHVDHIAVYCPKDTVDWMAQ